MLEFLTTMTLSSLKETLIASLYSLQGPPPVETPPPISIEEAKHIVANSARPAYVQLAWPVRIYADKLEAILTWVSNTQDDNVSSSRLGPYVWKPKYNLKDSKSHCSIVKRLLEKAHWDRGF